VAAPPCAMCGSPSARVELVAPRQLPAEWDQWNLRRQAAFLDGRDPDRWQLLFEGVAGGNGWVGDPIEAGRAENIAAAFRQPWSYAQIHTAGFHDDAGFCAECDAAYCYRHWHVSEIGFGHCPRGPGKSLDPLW